MRIISTVPSLTETLYDLNLEDEVVGITKFCVHPKEWFQSKERIGGTKNLNLQKIRELKPDLIIANKEENVRDQIEECKTFCDVYIDDTSNYVEALEAIETIGVLTNRKETALRLKNKIEKAFDELKLPRKKNVVYLIWKDPLMTVGNDTFIHDMMLKAGFENAYSAQIRYPVISEEELRSNPPDVLLLSSEPYPFSEKHFPYFKNLVPESEILFVDGEMFSWYGSRMQYAPSYFKKLAKKSIQK